MEKRIIYLIGYENFGGTSGWDWYPEKEQSDKAYQEKTQRRDEIINAMIENVKQTNGDEEQPFVYGGKLEVEIVGEFSDEYVKDDVTRLVEEFLEVNGFEKAFVKPYEV